MTPFNGIDKVLIDVAIALSPLIITFVIFQLIFLKMPKTNIINIIKGVILTYFGLVLFLQGVNVGYLPIGKIMGEGLAGIKDNWLLIPLGLLLGFCTTLAEPAVRVLIGEVEKVSAGHINRTLMLYCLCIGVAVAVALAMVRVLYGISFLWFIIPMYTAAFILTRFCSEDFVAIAFDAGGVATGPMTVTFILSLVMGVAEEHPGRSVLTDGFGMVALVAVMPIITVLLLGLLYRIKIKN